MADNYVEIQVRANDGARPDLAALKAALKDLNGQVADTRADFDAAAADAKLAAFKAELKDIASPDIKPDVDLGELDDKLDKLDDKLKDQVDKAREYASKLGEALANARERADKAGEEESQAGLATLSASLAKLNQTLAAPKVKISGAARATAELLGVKAELDKVKNDADGLGEKAKAGGGGIIGSFLGQMNSTVMEKGFLRNLFGMEKDAEDEGEKSGEGFLGGFLEKNVGKLITGGIATAMTMLPALAAGAGALAGIGLGAAFLIESNPAVKKAGESLMSTLKGVLTQATGPMIAPLEAAFKQIGQFAKSIEPQLKQVFSAVGPMIQPLVGGLEGLVKGLLPGFISLMKAAKPAVQAVSGILSGLGSGLGGMLSSFAPAIAASGKILGSLGPALQTILPAVGQLASSLANSLAPALPALIKGFGEFVKLLSGGIGRAVADLATGISAIAKWAPPLIPALLGIVAAVKLWKIAQALLDIALDANPIGLLIAAVAALIIIVVEIVKHFHDVEKAFDLVRHAAATLGHDLASVFDKMRHDIASKFDAIRHDIASKFDQIRHDIASWGDDVLHWFESLPGKIGHALASLPGLMLQAGKKAIEMLIQGLESIPVIGPMVKIAGDIADHLPHSPAKKGPLSGSGSPDVAGRMIARMLGQGLRAGLPDVTGAMARVTGAAVVRGGAGGLALGGAGANGTVKVQLEFVGGDEAILRGFRQAIRTRGGDVQKVLGAGKG